MYLKSEIIKHTIFAPYTPVQNGVAESYNRMIIEKFGWKYVKQV